jgi:tyrosyl-tRNA synthetase
MALTVKQTVDLLTARSVDLISAAELTRKLEAARLAGRPLRVKYGADPSAPDLHLGHVVGLRKLREFQDAGHLVVFIIGDFTGMIGDPSGKSATRPALTKAAVDAHAKTYQEQVFQVLDPDRTEVRFNSEWFGGMTFEEVIRLASRVTVAQMLARDDFSKRYADNRPISLVEFLYPLIQAYDSVMVDADVELGGTDQLFNLLLGREIQVAHGREPQVVMTLPLLEGLDGVQKMSKSLGNTIGVREDPANMFGKAMSISDDLMWRYFELILCRTAEELAPLRADVANGARHPRDVKEALAKELVTLFHGAREAEAAAEAFRRVFSEGQTPDDVPEVPLASLPLNGGSLDPVTLLRATGLASSNGEARRLIQQGGMRVNEEKLEDPAAALAPSPGDVIRAGKRRFVRLV